MNRKITIDFIFLYGLVGMIEENILEYCHKKIYEYSGTGKLLFEDGQEFNCEFVVFQMKDGEILFNAIVKQKSNHFPFLKRDTIM